MVHAPFGKHGSNNKNSIARKFGWDAVHCAKGETAPCPVCMVVAACSGRCPLWRVCVYMCVCVSVQNAYAA